MMVYALWLGLPAIVFLGFGASALGSGHKQSGRRGRGKLLGLFLMLLLLALLASCSGGFKATVVPPGAANSFSITVMGVVTDSAGQVTGVEIYTIAVPVTPQV